MGPGLGERCPTSPSHTGVARKISIDPQQLKQKAGICLVLKQSAIGSERKDKTLLTQGRREGCLEEVAFVLVLDNEKDSYRQC